ncbi:MULTISPECIES: imidazole glycerol phosphate synthase subunit HisH [Chryseobacterium]|uniref:Imidazole glycerol phosphate synthase subunit HisH n=1 Tax=Chryseobacterium camelliae TaxID=1265445 RepID=A0ABU0TJ23_9FLAO|nr:MULTISPECIES: imidazole glycerol phosphate synthase subunit HisH [Chryseobacterium]MDT3406016.1 glutamine amidotransferase [Pseudacidovorax intermedius]MDQ1096183.1 glutamine amidotransferase [Chryseobacterium camelliae]MDQ1100120.1 glutamine amidotransferase [Chryseobacterium sp. SORGH_AS_1048]MDR6087463.1 glutamine amidotransferase [Chryseobacterium sp. SORGH_AS_0909]MDR6131837.1 glutamine amidotransferase [Chryseobacterium sp. SORGH_AS_1175]
MIAIIKYNGGNVNSVQNALNRLNADSVVTDDFETIHNADKVIFPGVGEASSTMALLREKGLDRFIPTLQQPVLGICLGMQLMCGNNEEGNTRGMGIFDLEVKRFPPQDLVPHMGWNILHNRRSPLFAGFEQENDCYFVHSYYCELSEYTTSVCDYILPFSASLQKDNFFAVQFHPEKSGHAGNEILKNFLKLPL